MSKSTRALLAGFIVTATIFPPTPTREAVNEAQFDFGEAGKYGVYGNSDELVRQFNQADTQLMRRALTDTLKDSDKYKIYATSFGCKLRKRSNGDMIVSVNLQEGWVNYESRISGSSSTLTVQPVEGMITSSQQSTRPAPPDQEYKDNSMAMSTPSGQKKLFFAAQTAMQACREVLGLQ
jgi:hypothetical protein